MAYGFNKDKTRVEVYNKDQNFIKKITKNVTVTTGSGYQSIKEMITQTIGEREPIVTVDIKMHDGTGVGKPVGGQAYRTCYTNADGVDIGFSPNTNLYLWLSALLPRSSAVYEVDITVTIYKLNDKYNQY